MDDRSPPAQGLSRSQRLTRSSEIADVFAQRHSFVGRYMVLWLRHGDCAAMRLGVAAGKKLGGAVVRNRLKRRLREVFRRNRHRFSGPVDVLLVARRPLLRASWAVVEADLLHLARRAGLCAKDD